MFTTVLIANRNGESLGPADQLSNFLGLGKDPNLEQKKDFGRSQAELRIEQAYYTVVIVY
jgi:hypothetical protein